MILQCNYIILSCNLVFFVCSVSVSVPVSDSILCYMHIRFSLYSRVTVSPFLSELFLPQQTPHSLTHTHTHTHTLSPGNRSETPISEHLSKWKRYTPCSFAPVASSPSTPSQRPWQNQDPNYCPTSPDLLSYTTASCYQGYKIHSHLGRRCSFFPPNSNRLSVQEFTIMSTSATRLVLSA
jgi:hypothetical protein